MDTNTGESPGYQSESLYSLETHLVRKQGDSGHLRALSPWGDGWMYGYYIIMYSTDDIHICVYKMRISMVYSNTVCPIGSLCTHIKIGILERLAGLCPLNTYFVKTHNV